MDRCDFLTGTNAPLASGNAFADTPAASEISKKAARDGWLFALPLIEVAARCARGRNLSGAHPCR
jgi:hypothetical protein